MRKLLACIIIVAFLCSGAYVIHGMTQTSIYKDGAEFEAFAKKSLHERELFRDNSNTKTEYQYSEEYSSAIKKDTDVGEKISAFRDRHIEDIEDAYRLGIRLEGSETLAHACIIDSSVKRSGTGALSLIIYTKEYEESEKGMVLTDSSVKTYFFDDATGKRIWPSQAFMLGYKSEVSKFAQDYFTKSFSKQKLANGWEGHVVPTKDNFKDFIMTGESVIFYFQPGTVLDKSYGVVTLKVPQQYLQSSIRPRVLDRVIDPNKPMVALTYDDGPGGASEKRILDCLENHNAVATFFYQGYRMQKFAYNAKRAYEIGCEIGNHSWDHPQFTSLTKKQIGSQIDRTDREIQKVVGVNTKLVRPPYGENDKKITKVIKMKNKSVVLWSLDTRDWESRNAKKIFRTVKKAKKLDGKIILMHSIHKPTAKATELIIPWLEKNGYQIVTISELVYYKTGKSLEPGKIYKKVK